MGYFKKTHLLSPYCTFEFQLPPMPKDKYSAQFCSLLEKMMCKDSKTRPSADDILSDSLFTTFKKPKVRRRYQRRKTMNKVRCGSMTQYHK